ncbi:uncharacterized protein BXZ73DRAFT_51025, partial [Epithele typhae]|uniref:uncharacterized protein n=1 Tax=Epithele typhae TaxID=378194 RepID=UPI002008ACF7
MGASVAADRLWQQVSLAIHCCSPFRLLVDKFCHRSTVRLCTLPKSHPLHPHVARVSRHTPRHHHSPLHTLFRLYGSTLTPESTETILPVRDPPAPLHTSIADMKEKADESDERWRRKAGVTIYTDGSVIDGQVGAAVVLIRKRGGTPKVLRYHLGPATEQGIFNAETCGPILAAHML